MLRQELQAYFDRVYPHSQIDEEHSVGGPICIRFELGGELTDTIDRIAQSTNRALSLFNDTFDIQDHTIWTLIYEYPSLNSFNAPNPFLHQQFPADLFAEFYNQSTQIKSPSTTDKGDEPQELQETRVIIGQFAIKDINIKHILNGIANTEMGIDPAIDQRIYFIDPMTDKGFHMYDDRGCYIWSDSAHKISDIYHKRNNWIVDYHRPEIDKYFLS